MHNQPLRFRPQRKIRRLFHSDKPTLEGRYRPLSRELEARLASWADTFPAY